MEQFKVIIAGGRDFNDYELLRDKCNVLLSDKMETTEVVIVSGHARGTDSLGEKYAEERGLGVMLFPAEWDKYGKSAGYRRNVQMSENADALIAFWDGVSKGTKHMIDIATERGLMLRIIRY